MPRLCMHAHTHVLREYVQFHSESGWYYSYYNRLALDETTSSGLDNMFRNNQTEYPDVVNCFARFNLMQELVFGMVRSDAIGSIGVRGVHAAIPVVSLFASAFDAIWYRWMGFGAGV